MKRAPEKHSEIYTKIRKSKKEKNPCPVENPGGIQAAHRRQKGEPKKHGVAGPPVILLFHPPEFHLIQHGRLLIIFGELAALIKRAVEPGEHILHRKKRQIRCGDDQSGLRQ